ncbi:MAG: DUF4239 domain-containing protein, partial [Holophaga sp.]|nr:DUF4239 domain-containing protein [Holophaga sp.]
MLNFANKLGAYPSVLLVLAVFIAASVLCAAFIRRFTPWLLFERESAGSGQVVGPAIGTMFALVFAMVTVAVWQNFDRVGSAVEEEAHCLHNIYRSMEPYPPEVREPVRGLLRDYLRQVVDREWASIQTHDVSEDPAARRLITEVDARIT